MTVTNSSASAKQPEQKGTQQQSEGKATAPIFSDESSESVVSVRSDENASNKGSPVKKGVMVSSSETFEAGTEEVYLYVCIYLVKCLCMYIVRSMCISTGHNMYIMNSHSL